MQTPIDPIEQHELRNVSLEVIAKLLLVSRRLAGTSELADVLSTVIDALRDLLNAERATVFEYDPKNNQLFTQVAHGIDQAGPGIIRIPANRGIAGAAAQELKLVHIPDAYKDPRFNQEIDKVTGFRTRNILAIPLIDHEGGLVGVAQVLNSRHGSFTEQDQEIALGLSAQAAVAIRRGRLMEDRVARERMERDLQAARSIQQSSFPSALPPMKDWQVAASGIPAEQCGGDAFDVIPLVQKTIVEPSESPDEVVLLVADATGHGIGSALSAMQVRGMLRIGLRLKQGVRRIAEEANRQLCQDLPMGRFVTAWYARISLHNGVVESYAAGQGPIIHYRRREDDFITLPTDNAPLGVMIDDTSSETTVITMHVGDILIALTDGYYESEGPNGEQYQQKPVEDLVRKHRDRTPEEILQLINESLMDWTSAAPAADDRTAIVLKRIAK
ncbi:MAG: SpoIIE family protein phosphatase [Planctomycetes bacterium]|nr:SpoIIE family protein phosphatase [Planctomycetota bacterium]